MDNPAFNATLVARTDLNQRLAIVRIQPDQGPLPPFVPGQFCTLGLPRENSPTSASAPNAPAFHKDRVRLVRRAYSIASDAREKKQWELLVVLVDEGKLTPRLWTIPQGGRLFLDPKVAGQFTLESLPVQRDLVLVATGTGLGPFMSMIRSYVGSQRWRRLALIHGVREPGDLAYREELQSLAGQNANRLVYLPIISRPDTAANWTGLRGRVQQVLEPATFARHAGWNLDPQQTHVLLCGNPAMVQDVQVQLKPLGFANDSNNPAPNLHFERYW